MSKYSTIVLIILILLGLIFGIVYSLRPSTYCIYKIDVNSTPLNEILDISIFEGVEPRMSKQEVIKILGETNQVFEEEDPVGIYERWEWGKPRGIIKYYFEATEDGGIGSPEFHPNNIDIKDLLYQKPSIVFEADNKYLIEIKGINNRPSLTVRTNGIKVMRVNYYFTLNEPLNS